MPDGFEKLSSNKKDNPHLIENYLLPIVNKIKDGISKSINNLPNENSTLDQNISRIKSFFTNCGYSINLVSFSVINNNFVNEISFGENGFSIDSEKLLGDLIKNLSAEGFSEAILEIVKKEYLKSFYILLYACFGLRDMSVGDVLLLFGKDYQEVLDNPDGNDNKIIRLLMTHSLDIKVHSIVTFDFCPIVHGKIEY